jgi:hypothetical protein
MHIGILWRNLKEEVYLEVLDVDGVVILEY